MVLYKSCIVIIIHLCINDTYCLTLFESLKFSFQVNYITTK